jgi:hypothetical protein
MINRDAVKTALSSSLSHLKFVVFLTFFGSLYVSPARAVPLTAAQKAKGQQITALLTKTLRHRITSPGGHLQLRVVPATRADQGYFSEIFISAKPAQIKKRRFSELILRARNVRISPSALLSEDKDIVTLASQTTMRAVVTEGELTAALAKGQDSADKGLRVQFVGNDLVRVTGNWKWSWFSGPMDATGRLRLGSGHTVVADIYTLKLNGRNVPQGLKNKFSEKINPLIDYTDLPFRPPFKNLRFSGPKAIIST